MDGRATSTMRIVNVEVFFDGLGEDQRRSRVKAGHLGPQEIPFYKGLIHATVTL